MKTYGGRKDTAPAILCSELHADVEEVHPLNRWLGGFENSSGRSGLEKNPVSQDGDKAPANQPIATQAKQLDNRVVLFRKVNETRI
jgi:hypothetical protein